MPHHLLREQPCPGVLLLSFNRPERKNALNNSTANAFADAIAAADEDAGIRVIVVTGVGGNFSSGGDLDDFQNLKERTHPPAGQRMMLALNDAAKPVIAAVEGLAIGGCVTMLQHFDLVYAGRSARFMLPFINLGTCPEGASSYYLPLIAGYRKAAELLMLGEFFSAESARDVGLVNQITADGEALEQALGSARKIAAKLPESVRLTKMLMREGHREAVRRVIDREHGLFTERLHTPEVQANLAAMRERAKAKS
jgi:enoyl-CoA hydratase/carnithine racemase